MKKTIGIIAALMICAGAVSAQNYKWGLGARVGGESVGFTVKHKFSPRKGMEGILSFPWDDGFIATALYQWHIPVITSGFAFYYGPGAHIGAWDDDFAIGVDFMAGLEYKISKIPLSLSLDYKPMFTIASDTKFHMADIAFSIRYVF